MCGWPLDQVTLWKHILDPSGRNSTSLEQMSFPTGPVCLILWFDFWRLTAVCGASFKIVHTELLWIFNFCGVFFAALLICGGQHNWKSWWNMTVREDVAARMQICRWTTGTVWCVTSTGVVFVVVQHYFSGTDAPFAFGLVSCARWV